MHPAPIFVFMSLALAAGCGSGEEEHKPGQQEEDPCPPPEEDKDGDCFAPPEDCDDNDPYTYPGAPEVPYDGIDQDCDGEDLVDVDGDGFIGVGAGGDDCNDNNPEIYPGAEETCEDRYAGRDMNCDGSEQTNDCDGDGWDRWDDCNDDDPTSYPGADEIWYDGIDQNCDMKDDYDQDEDGQRHDGYGGEDCDDTDPTIYQGARERWDDADNNCDGVVDQLYQSHAEVEFFGTYTSYSDYMLGWAVSWGGDYDGDGLPDLFVSAPLSGKDSSGKPTYAGLVYLLPGSGPEDYGYPGDARIAEINGGSGAYLGYGMSVVGDLDGDGLAEVVVGVPLESVGGSTGAGLLYRGADLAAGGTFSTTDSWAALYGSSYYGVDIEGAGDVDGDGVPDIVVGSGDINTCKLTVYSGATAMEGANMSGAAGIATFTGTGYGSRTAAGGDFDGDGLSDLVVGCDSFSVDGETGEVSGKNGSLYILTAADLEAGGSLSYRDFSAITGSSGVGLGYRPAWTGDVTGDGYDEIVAATPFADSSVERGGEVHVLPASARDGGSVASLAWFTVEGTTRFGMLSSADEPADFDGDGRGDLVVSHVGDQVSRVQGYSWVILGEQMLGGGTMAATDGVASFTTRYTDDAFGQAISFTDYDGSGTDDVAIGSWNAAQGIVWIFTNDRW